MIRRDLEKGIRLYGLKYPVIAITGPRQSGKTTLLKTLFSDYEYVSLENPDTRIFAETDPNGFLNRFAEKVIFDEIQRVPQLFSYIQTRVDESQLMGRYILSGSQNFHLMKSITQSLAGRVAVFKLFPFDLQELKAAGCLADNYLDNLLKGFYPAIYDREIPSRIFYSNYIQTYIQRDVSELLAIKDIKIFQNFLGLCAARAGQFLNMNSLANECGISQPTAKSWLSALESSYIVFHLHPYHKNFNKRIVKTPKIYFYDTGLLCHLLKISSTDQLLTHPVKGNLFENMMVAEYLKRINHENRFEDIWFWRDSAGREIDLLIEDGKVTRLAEMKAGMTVMPDMFETLAWWKTISGEQNIAKMLVYGGNENQSRSAGDVVSWRDFGK